MKNGVRLGGMVTAGLLFGLAGVGCGGGHPLGGKDGGRDAGDAPRDGSGDAPQDGSGDAADGPARQTWVFDEAINRDLDVLFMVDNSFSMSPLQAKLATNFPGFIQVLQSLPNGLPNLHLAVVSSNMGVGRFEVPMCPRGGDQGIFQSGPRGMCTATGLQAGQTFISNVNGQPNYTGTIDAVFSCISQLGDQGCGFEHQLSSVVRALGADGFPPPPANANFLRPNAYLAIIVVTNEDDCSMPEDSELGDPGSRLVSDALGPLASFRCNEYGHLCNGAPPPRTRAVTFGPGECVPAEGAGQLVPVATLVEQVTSLKADPSKILVSVIGGLPDPYSVQLTEPTVRSDPAMWPSVQHSCTQNSGEYADPGVRLAAFVRAFGRNGVYQSACADSFVPALQRIAEEIGRTMGPRCVDQPIPMVGDRPDCTVVAKSHSQEGLPVTTPVPACADAPGASSCWTLVPGNVMSCAGQRQLLVSRQNPDPTGTYFVLSCAVCEPGDGNAGCP